MKAALLLNFGAHNIPFLWLMELCSYILTQSVGGLGWKSILRTFGPEVEILLPRDGSTREWWLAGKPSRCI